MDLFRLAKGQRLSVFLLQLLPYFKLVNLIPGLVSSSKTVNLQTVLHFP